MCHTMSQTRYAHYIPRCSPYFENDIITIYFTRKETTDQLSKVQ